MKYCDLHCDYLYTVEKEEDIQIPPTFSEGIFWQTFAVFSPNERANMAFFQRKYQLFRRIRQFLPNSVLSVENGAILEGKVENVSLLKSCGVRFFGLVWNGGNGLAGSHGQSAGLTSLGRQVAEALFAEGVVPDLSHLSDRGIEEVCRLAKAVRRPIIASHSCARALCNVSRNLTDGQAKKIADLGGKIGVNFYRPFLGGYSVAQHVLHFVRVAGEDAVCIGSDFEGANDTFYPNRAVAAAELEKAFRGLGVGQRVIEKVFFRNATKFLSEIAE